MPRPLLPEASPGQSIHRHQPQGVAAPSGSRDGWAGAAAMGLSPKGLGSPGVSCCPSAKEPQDSLALPLPGSAPRAAAARHSPWGLQLWQGLGRDHSPQVNIQEILNPVQMQRPTVGALWREGPAHHQPQHGGFVASTSSWSTSPQAVQDPRGRKRNDQGTASQGSELCRAAPLACGVTAE